MTALGVVRPGRLLALCAGLVLMGSAAAAGECPRDAGGRLLDPDCVGSDRVAKPQTAPKARPVPARAYEDVGRGTAGEPAESAPGDAARPAPTISAGLKPGDAAVLLGGLFGSAIAANPAGSRHLTPVRAYLRAADVPPAGIGAYGIVAFRAKPTTVTRQRLLMACRAFQAYLPPQASLPSSVGKGDQMLTVWPVDDPTAPGARADSCDFAVDHYDLYGGLSAIEDAERQGPRLGGEGPYLIGWSPSSSRGVRDKIVLVVDMTGFDSQDSFNRAFEFWQKKVVDDPSLWRTGFSVEKTRLAIRDFLDHYGADLLGAVKMAGLTPK